MTTNQLLLAVAAGLIAAVVFASATTGPLFIRLILFFLTPLSLYLAGLGLAPAASAIAATVATLVILLITQSPIPAIVFAVSAGIPAAYTTRLALLGRQEGDEIVEWYPIGRILLAAAAFAGLFAALAVSIIGSDMAALTKAMRGLVETFVKTEMPKVPNATELTGQQIDEITQRVISLLPMTLAGLSLTTTLLNLWLAGRITLASGRLVRPWPEFGKISLPTYATFALLVAMIAAFLDGIPGLIAGGFAGALILAFTVVGLAVAHDMTVGSPWRGFLLMAVYVGLAFLTPAAVLLLAITGIADTIFAFRAARLEGPTNPET